MNPINEVSCKQLVKWVYCCISPKKFAKLWIERNEPNQCLLLCSPKRIANLWITEMNPINVVNSFAYFVSSFYILKIKVWCKVLRSEVNESHGCIEGRMKKRRMVSWKKKKKKRSHSRRNFVCFVVLSSRGPAGGKGKVKRHPCIALETLDSHFTFTPWSLHGEAGPAGSGS